MEATIKGVQVQLKVVEGLPILINEVDINRILTRRQRSKRGRPASKETLANFEKPYRIGGVIYFELIYNLDNCYFNNHMVKFESK
jgi:hypothetical protein